MQKQTAQILFGESALSAALGENGIIVVFEENPNTLYSGAVEFNNDDFVNIATNVLSTLGINISVAPNPYFAHISSIYLNNRSAVSGANPDTQQYGNNAAQAVFRSCSWLERNKKIGA